MRSDFDDVRFGPDRTARVTTAYAKAYNAARQTFLPGRSSCVGCLDYRGSTIATRYQRRDTPLHRGAATGFVPSLSDGCAQAPSGKVKPSTTQAQLRCFQQDSSHPVRPDARARGEVVGVLLAELVRQLKHRTNPGVRHSVDDLAPPPFRAREPAPLQARQVVGDPALRRSDQRLQF